MGPKTDSKLRHPSPGGRVSAHWREMAWFTTSITDHMLAILTLGMLLDHVTVHIFYTFIDVSVGLYHCLVCVAGAWPFLRFRRPFPFKFLLSVILYTFAVKLSGFWMVFTCSRDNSSVLHIWIQLSIVRLFSAGAFLSSLYLHTIS